MKGQINNFKIEKLYGYKNYEILIEDNTLIMVGENGSGKTSILRILFYFLSGQWENLSQYKFEKVSLLIDGKRFEYENEFAKTFIPSLYDDTNKKNISPFRKYNTESFVGLPRPIKNYVMSIYEANRSISLEDIKSDCRKLRLPFNIVVDVLNAESYYIFNNRSNYSKKIEEIKLAVNYQILYLPTYRRIEQEEEKVLKGYGRDRNSYSQSRIIEQNDLLFTEQNDLSFTELKEFGMSDVERKIKQTLDNLQTFTREQLNDLTLHYLDDVINKKYEKVELKSIRDVQQDTIDRILERIDDKVLSSESKKHLSNTIQNVKNSDIPSSDLNAHEKVVCHYFLKLINFHKNVRKKEERIASFCEICNQYLVDKKLNYDSVNFEFYISLNKQEGDFSKIYLKDLSSGEKQIISLFSHLYLSEKNGFFVIIDEPELSLSVTWQKRFLVDVKKCEYCLGVISATHSPLIYNENELEKYTHGLGEFAF